MDPAVLIGVIVGVLALVFAVAVTVWAIKVASRGMRSAAKSGVASIPKQELKSVLLKLNNPQHPFRLESSSETDLTIEWCVADAKWIEVLGQASAKASYLAWILLDEKRQTVKYWEQLTEINLSAGGGGAFASSHASRGFDLWGRRTSRRWGIRPDFSIGEVLSYDFTPADVKDLVRQIANDHGWNFELVMLKRHAKYA